MRLKLLTFILFLYANTVIAQEPITIAFTEKEGLPDVEFYDLLEDKSGFIWLAADKGLFRYDGKQFNSYNLTIKRGLSVFGLQEDEKGRIWCNNISGQFFYIENNQLHLFIDLKDDLKGQLPEFIIRNEFLYVFYEKGIFEIDLQTKHKRVVDNNNSFSFFGAPFLFQNEIYFAVANHVKKIDQHKSLEVFQFHPSLLLLKNSTFWNVKKTLFFNSWFENKQHFYVQLNNGFKEINVPKKIQEATIIRAIVKEETIWFCTNKGLFVCNWNGTKLNLLFHYLKENTISKLIQDKNNNYWVSTIGNGIIVLPNIGIQKIETNNPKESIKAILSIPGAILYGNTKGEIGIWNTASLSLQKFQLPSSSEITQMVYDTTTQTVFISQKEASYFWDLNSALLYPSDSFTASKGICYDGDKNLLNASFDRASIAVNPFGIFQKHKQILRYKIPKVAGKKINISNILLRQKRAYTCFYDKNSAIKYIGFVDELIQLDSNNKPSPIRYNKQPLFCNDIQKTKNNIIWIATFTNGVFGIKNGKICYHLKHSNGLFSNQIRKLKSDGELLWIVNDGGIQAFNTTTYKYQNITEVDGFVNYNIVAITTLNNKLYLASNDGIYILDKRNCFKTIPKPEIYFTGFSIQENTIPLEKKYNLSYQSNDIKITFNTNGYKSKENIRYQYRLKGYNEKWLQLDKGIDFVRYSSLPSGNFIFEVKAYNHHGSFSKPIALFISIKSPFWQTWWFYILLLGIISIGIWLFFKKRLQRVEMEKQKEIEKMQLDKELISSQLENLRSQMNPHFIFNALNSIQEYILTNEKANASVFLVKFSRLIRMYLEHSRENEITIEEEIQALTMYLELEKDRFEDALEYQIEIDPNLAISKLKIPSLFVQPYVENALKHGLLHKKTNRKLKVLFMLNQEINAIECSIEDNGIGRLEAEKIKQQRQHLHRSFATSANQKRVELINKIRPKKTVVTVNDLYDSSKNAIGTLVKITIPF